MASEQQRTSRRVLVIICCLMFMVACTQTATPTIEAVRFSVLADTSTLLLMEQLVPAYQDERPYVSIALERAVNAEQARAALHDGRITLATVSWFREDTEAEAALWYRSIARDPIVMITHSTNPVGEITLLQLRRIYQGQTLLWTELGGEAIDVVAVSREPGSGTRSSFESLVMGNHDVASISIVMPSSETVIEYVSRTPGAIAYVSSAWLVPTVNILTVEGVAPSLPSVENGRYLLSRPFYLVALSEPAGGVADFVHWVKDGAGQEIIKRGYALAP
jgi:phosphate transport system substrate-binding protein